MAVGLFVALWRPPLRIIRPIRSNVSGGFPRGVDSLGPVQFSRGGDEVGRGGGVSVRVPSLNLAIL